MKKIPIIIALLFWALNLFAQTPQKFSHQIVLRNASNDLVVSTLIGMRVSILQTTSTGTVVFSERQTPTTNAEGIASIEVGTGTLLSGAFATINWANGPYFIKIECDLLGGTTYTTSRTSQLLSVPYALYAPMASNVFDGNYNSLINKPAGNAAGDLQYWDGTSWANLPIGQPGQILKLNASKIPTWTNKLPTLTTTTISAITTTTAASGGTIASDGGSPITARGVCWSTTPNPTINSSKTTNGAGIGTFTSSITGLAAATSYYVRAYATNSIGTSYGDEFLFPTILTVGTAYQGGIIAYILQPGDFGYDANVQHGLIAAPSDQSTGIQWYNGSNTITGATGITIGTGNANTNIIVVNQGSGSYAAKLCADLILGGYSDWYLPSKDELGKMYLNRVAIGNFTINYYWSSSEQSSNVAGNYNFSNGSSFGNAKILTYYVRAARAF